MLAKLLAGKEQSDLSDEAMAYLSEIADFQKMNEIRARVASTVSDPADGRSAQAVVRAVVQTPDLQRRVSPHLQPAQREAGGHQGQRCRSRDRDTQWSWTALSTKWTA